MNNGSISKTSHQSLTIEGFLVFWYNVQMRNIPDNFSTKEQSATSFEVADSPNENQVFPTLDQSNFTPNHKEIHSESMQENLENERTNFDSDLRNEIRTVDQELEAIIEEEVFINENNLKSFINTHYSGKAKALDVALKFFDEQSTLGVKVSENELKRKVNSELKEKQELSTADQVKQYTESIRKGKSDTEILKLLITKFQNNRDVSVWVQNWKQFLRLHELAKTKPPQEQRAIQKIISKADFSSENAFVVSLNSIRSSTEISDQTKFEILAEFDGSSFTTVDQMDAGLKFLRNRKEQATSLLNTKVEQLDSLNSDIENLRKKIDNLSPGDPHRKEFEDQLSHKKDLLKNTQQEVELLETESNRENSFEIRHGFIAKLNPDGSRSLKNPENFSLRFPSNALPFTGMKNLRSANLAIACSPLIRLGILDEVFRPNIENNAVPSKAQRSIGHFILENLGFDDSIILPESDIRQLDKDLSRLMKPSGVKSPRQHLIDLGLYDIKDQALNMKQFERALIFTKENRYVLDDDFSEKLKEHL